DNRRRARKVSTLSGILFVVVFIIAVFVFLWNYWLDDVFTSPETMTVPELTGGRLEDVLINPSYTDYYNIIPSYESSDTVEIGYIMAQTPAAGRTVIKNSERKSDLKVVVSSGDSYVIMPEVVNSEYRQAYITLQKLKLEIEVTTISSDEVTEGYVITSVPAAGVELKAGDKVYLTVSGGPEIKYLLMPDLVGNTIEVAKGILETSNLILGTVSSVDDEAPEGQVIFQNIIAGTEIAENTKVNISISNGSRAPQAPEGGEVGGEEWADPEIPGESFEEPDNGAEAPDIG
ncbi:MAG: PASTA domain-containing protein, partial [Oscillospiraceae bacterium]|nr:PASTA domain-containing protein [Oscillospiraceae bacterium]